MPLYESAFHAAAAVALWRLRAAGLFRWQLLKLYLAAYCAFRFGVEFIRVEPRVWRGLTAYQIGAAAFAAALGLHAWVDERRKRSLPEESGGIALPGPAN